MYESIEDKNAESDHETLRMNSDTAKKPFMNDNKLKIAGASIAALAIGSIGALSFSLFANRAQGRPADLGKAMNSAGKGKPKPANPNSTAKNRNADGADIVENAGARRSLDFYTKGVRGSLFSAPQPPPAPKPRAVVVKPLPPPPRIVVPEVKPVEINPFADWSYTGTVTVGETKMALIENAKTKEGRYLKQGEEFQGAQVSQVTDQMVTMTAGTKPYLLAKSDNINIVPLDKSAAYLGGAQPGQPVPPPPGGAAVLLSAQTAPGATVLLPNGTVLKGNRAVKYDRYMNRKFK